MSVRIINGDCRDVLKTLPDASVNCCVTSPPYWGLRDYGCAGQIGMERTPEEYVQKLVDVFREVRRVLRDDGTLWLNIGDSYAGSSKGFGDTKTKNKGNVYCRIGQRKPGYVGGDIKPKDLIGIPWMVAFALRADGWYLRQDIIRSKPNPMPESVKDRCTKAHEYIFLLSKSARYYFDASAIAEQPVYGGNDARYKRAVEGQKSNPDAEKNGIRPRSWNGSQFHDGKNLAIHPNTGKKRIPAGWKTGKGNHGNFHEDGRAREVEYTAGICETRNKRSVWTVPTYGYRDAHFATFPPALIRPCILAGCPVGGTCLDPFGGSGTVGEVCEMEGRNSILIELNPAYVKLAEKRTEQRGLFAP